MSVNDLLKQDCVIVAHITTGDTDSNGQPQFNIQEESTKCYVQLEKQDGQPAESRKDITARIYLPASPAQNFLDQIVEVLNDRRWIVFGKPFAQCSPRNPNVVQFVVLTCRAAS